MPSDINQNNALINPKQQNGELLIGNTVKLYKTLLAIKNIIGLGYAHAKDIFVNGIFYGS